jgi:DedD protein
MASSQDTEITLGTGKLLVLFFGLVAVCALFFAMGYSLGRKSEPAVTTASASVPPQASANTSKSSSGSDTSNPQMSSYKSTEQKNTTGDLTPSTESKADRANSLPNASSTTRSSSGVDPSTTIPTSGYFVQVAAVSKQEDASSLVDALKKKDYSAFVASNATGDKLYRVQVGPFSDIKDAESVRAKLVSDGYSPILKK